MKVETINIQEWNAYLEQCSTATFFHTPDWYQLWKHYKGQEYQTFQFNFPSGNSAIIPLAKEKKHRRLFTYYVSSPGGTYGGPVSKGILVTKEILAIEQYLLKFKYITIRNNPLQPVLNGLINKKESTQILNLKLSWEAIFKKWSKGHASAAKKSMREGITFRTAHLSEWESYFEIYLKTLSRWEQPPARPYTWDLFSHLQKIDEQKSKLWLAFKGDLPVAGALCFYFQKHVVYWHGASLEDYQAFKPVHGLQMHIIKEAIQKGYHWYDFNPSGGHDGVVRFKKGFGAEFVASDVYSKTPGIISWLIK